MNFQLALLAIKTGDTFEINGLNMHFLNRIKKKNSTIEISRTLVRTAWQWILEWSTSDPDG